MIIAKWLTASSTLMYVVSNLHIVRFLNLAAVESFITYVYVVDLLNGDIRRSIGVWSQITNSITAAILEESWMWIVCGLEVPGHKE
jgi:hypothetical protein